MLGYPEHVFEIEAREDAGWTFFLDTIYPSAIDLRIMDDDHLCDCLRDQGDDLVTPRRIDHRAYFGDEVSRQRFIKLVRSSGYDIAGLLDPGGASEEYGVTFSAMGAPSDISSIVAPLYGAARKLGGRYDGWETEVVVRPGPHN
jgi:Regulator of ribonuclease activity B